MFSCSPCKFARDSKQSKLTRSKGIVERSSGLPLNVGAPKVSGDEPNGRDSPGSLGRVDMR